MRPVYILKRIDQMAYALGVPPERLGLPVPTAFELAQHYFHFRCEELNRLLGIRPRFERKIDDRKIKART